MKSVARFTIRPNGDKDDLILGGVSRDSPLKSGRIYEIREILGVLTIVDLGPSEIKIKRNRTGASWNCDINGIITNGLNYALMTEQDFNEKESN
ncbi:MAG: hypothetical protein KME47_09830 [Nodosilinea sp. WJT8-NPBG4]|jgi:hypothetical protein|nr:hypothetical protein [Nodosilinea sp. WJT8-NPBG4]